MFKGLLVVALTLTVFVAAPPKADAMLIPMTVDQLAEAANTIVVVMGGRIKIGLRDVSPAGPLRQELAD